MMDDAMRNVIEPCPVDDVFCTELVKVTRIGPCLRLLFVVSHRDEFESSGI